MIVKIFFQLSCLLEHPVQTKWRILYLKGLSFARKSLLLSQRNKLFSFLKPFQKFLLVSPNLLDPFLQPDKCGRYLDKASKVLFRAWIFWSDRNKINSPPRSSATIFLSNHLLISFWIVDQLGSKLWYVY